MNKERLLKPLKWLWVIAVCAFLGIYLYQHLPEEIIYLQSIQATNIICSVLLLIIGKVALVELARLSVYKGGWGPPLMQMFSIISISQLGKYIPGGIWHFAARINSYKENSLTTEVSAKVMLLENIWLVSGALFSGLFMLSLHPPIEYLNSLIQIDLSSTFWIVLRITLPIIWIIGLVILEHTFKLDENYKTWRRIISLALIQIIIWLAIGGSFFFIFNDIGYEYFFLIVGGYTISWVAGYVVIFAPGGIGVREFILVTLFSNLVPIEQITIYTIVHRLLYTLVEVAMGGIGFAIHSHLLRENKVNNGQFPEISYPEKLSNKPPEQEKRL